MSRKIFLPRPEVENSSLTSSPPVRDDRRSVLGCPDNLRCFSAKIRPARFYKGECQEKYFSLDRKWRIVASLPAPLCAMTDARFWAALTTFVAFPLKFALPGSIKGNVKKNISPSTGSGE